MGALIGLIGPALLHLILPSVATVVAGYALVLIKKQLARVGIQLTEAQDDQVRTVVMDSIRAVEEMSHRQEKTTGQPIPPDQKSDIVVNKVSTALPHLELGRATILNKVDENLPFVRATIATSTAAALKAFRPGH